ncbi:hypothetical protein llap_19038 [Limosa lapponica baueri]|uniref:ribonuclease H n=1 Tax=Limosa lapponica baueri TaxID=1758121 RepID=A0A2I0TA36_LIMLA|nr:hypothetical protein llap_19038 [Limosa lapponica baueri]
MDLRMYWTSKTAIPEIIIVIFYITAGQTENCTTHQDLDDVPDPEDWTRNGYLGNSKPLVVQLEAISSCPIVCYLGEETNPHLSTTSFQVVVESDKVSSQPPFLQAKQSLFSQLLLIRLVLQTPHWIRCPSLNALQHLSVLLVVRGPKLDTVLEMGLHQCRVQGDDRFPSPSHHTVPDTDQDAVGLLGHLGAVLAHPLTVLYGQFDGDWWLTVGYDGLNEVTPLLSAALPDMLELQYELESKAAKWDATTDIANAFFSIPSAAECRPQFAFTWRGIQYTWNQLPQGWKHSPTICHGLMEEGGAPEYLQYIDDIIVCGNTAEVFRKGMKIIKILLKAGFAVQRAGDNGPTWSLWQKAPGETRGQLLGFWSQGYKGSEANYTPTEKEILAAYEGVRAASEGNIEGGKLLYGILHDKLQKQLKEKVNRVNLLKAIQLALDIAEQEKWPM